MVASSALPAAATPSATAEQTDDPATVHVGAYVDNIQVVNLATNSFDADLYVWLRWRDPDLEPQDGLQIMNLFQSWSLVSTPSSTEPQRLEDGSYYYRVRYQGSFNTPFNVADYPFDAQRPQIVLQSSTTDSTALRFVADTEPIGIDPTMTLPGYDIGMPTLDIADYTYPTTFGSTGGDQGRNTYSRAVISVPLASPVVSGFTKTVLPILLVIATAFLVFFVPVQFVEARVGLVITSLLTLVAMQLGISSELPEVTYLLMLDVLYLCAYGFILLTMADVIVRARQVRQGDTETAQRRNRQVMLVVGVTYLLATLAAMAFYIGQ